MLYQVLLSPIGRAREIEPMKSAILKGGTLLALGALFAWSIGAATGYVLGVVTFALTLGLILPDDFD